MNVQPLPKVEVDTMTAPVKTHASPYTAPGPSVPPLTTTASAIDNLTVKNVVGHADDSAFAGILARLDPLDTPAPVAVYKRGAPMTYTERETVAKLAQDVVLYGDLHMDDILRSYDMTQEQFDESICTSAAYLAAAALAKRQLDDDPHLPERLKAKAMVGTHMAAISTLVGDPMVDVKERLRAFEMLKDLADMGPRKQNAQEGNGMQVMINFGGTLGAALNKNVGNI